MAGILLFGSRIEPISSGKLGVTVAQPSVKPKP